MGAENVEGLGVVINTKLNLNERQENLLERGPVIVGKISTDD